MDGDCCRKCVFWKGYDLFFNAKDAEDAEIIEYKSVFPLRNFGPSALKFYSTGIYTLCETDPPCYFPDPSFYMAPRTLNPSPELVTDKLAKLLNEHSDKRVMVVGGTCTGKSTLVSNNEESNYAWRCIF